MANFNDFLRAVKVGDKNAAKSNFDKEFLNKNDEDGFKPIHWACLNNQVVILEWLLKLKCDIEATAKNGWRAVHCAVAKRNKEILKILVCNYCELQCTTDSKETPLDITKNDCRYDFIDKVSSENLNKQIGFLMGLKCNQKCKHRFCLTSMSGLNFVLGELMCNGAYGKIYKVEESIGDRRFAIKVIKSNSSDKTKYIEQNINDFRLLLNHPRIVKYYCGMQKLSKFCIFMEYMSLGSIFDEVKSKKVLSENQICQYTRDILEGISFLHKNKIIHRNINPSKAIKTKNGGCRILLSRHSRIWETDDIEQPQNGSNTFGIVNYMAPEIISNEPYSYPVDIWSMGATIIHMLTGHKPYHEMIEIAVIFKITTTKKLVYSPLQPTSGNLEKLLNEMLSPDPTERPNVDKLLNYEILKNIPITGETNDKDTEKSLEETIAENLEDCKYLLESTIEFKKIAKSMGLKCEMNCDHKFCLNSVAALNFTKKDCIGRGAFGTIFKTKESQSERVFAVKTLKIILNDDVNIQAMSLEKDLNTYRDFIQHERIVKYFGAIRTPKKMYIFMEFMSGGSIRRQIIKNGNKPLADDQIKKYAKQILEGLQFLHQSDIIHRDIKSENILLNSNGDIKLADFGLSRFLKTIMKDKEKCFCGTANYMAPEIINDEPYDFKVDIWSVGATIIEMLTGFPPYHGIHESAVIFKVGQNRKIEYPKDITNDFANLLDKMVTTDPAKRSSAAELLESAFFN